MTSPAPSYRGYRFPPDIIAHAVWLYFRFSLSFRDVEDLLAQRGITVTYETIRRWCRTCVARSAGRMPDGSGNGAGVSGTRGIWMSCSSPCMVGR